MGGLLLYGERMIVVKNDVEEGVEMNSLWIVFFDWIKCCLVCGCWWVICC